MKLRVSLLVSLLACSLAACTTETVYRTGPQGDAVSGESPAEGPPSDDSSEADAGSVSPPKKDAGSDTGTGKPPSSGPGAPPQPGPTPAPAGGVDRNACVGPASSSGSIYSTTPNVKAGSVVTDSSSGGLKLVLLPNAAALAANDIVIGLYFTPIPGQLDYSPNGSVGCAVLKYTGSAWQVVDKTQLCELHFSQLQPASAAGVCDGTIAGTYNGIFSGNQPLAGSFVLPSKIAASQISAPACRPHDSVCSTHADCCSKSCNQFLGVCL